MVVIGSGFAGSTATLSFLEAAEKAGQVGRVALIEAGKRGTWPGGSRWTRPFLRLDRDNTLLSDRVEGVEQNLSDLDYWRKLEDEVPYTVEFMEDHGVKLIHHDEENAALDLEEQHFAYQVGGGKEILDDYVDTDGRVLDTNEAPIPGLYAAGEITGLYHKHPPATSVLRANTFGRIVGTNVAESLSAAPTG